MLTEVAASETWRKGVSPEAAPPAYRRSRDDNEKTWERSWPFDDTEKTSHTSWSKSWSWDDKGNAETWKESSADGHGHSGDTSSSPNASASPSFNGCGNGTLITSSFISGIITTQGA